MAADAGEPRIVHEDEALLVVDKPAGLVVHPAPSVKQPTLVDWLGGRAGGGEPDRPGIVHRLDKDTSGLMVVARDEATRRALSDQIKAPRGEPRVPRPGRGRAGLPHGHDRRPARAATGAGAPAGPCAARASARPAPTSR